MTNRMLEEPCEKFLAKLASEAPTPGGGGAAALAGAIGAALVSMVANLTLGKKKYFAVEGQIKPLLKKSEQLRDRLEHLVDADALAFGNFMQAYRLPHTTNEEADTRKAAIGEAARDAAAVPLQIGDVCLEVLLIAKTIVSVGNTSVVTDAAVAALLARAAVRSACYNVEINLPLLTDKKFAAQVQERLGQLQRQSQAAETAVLAVTDKCLGK